MQGVVVSYDKNSEVGVLMANPDKTYYPFAPGALDKSVFTNLRQGQRVNFDIDDANKAVNIRIGSESDMGISTARV